MWFWTVCRGVLESESLERWLVGWWGEKFEISTNYISGRHRKYTSIYVYNIYIYIYVYICTVVLFCILFVSCI